MRLATFNMENLDLPPRAEHPIEVRVRALRPMLERLDADVLCLQEVNGQHVPGRSARALVALDHVLAGTPYASFHRAATRSSRGEGVGDVHNLVTLSRYPVLGSEEVRQTLVKPLAWAASTAEPAGDTVVQFDRPLLVTTLDIAGVATTIVNVHLRAPIAAPIPGQKLSASTWRTTAGWAEGFFLSAVKRAQQALEIRLLIDRLLDADPDRRIAIAGDFNAEDHDTALTLAVAAEEDTGNAALASRSLVVLDRALPGDRRWSMRLAGRVEMPDHILVSPALYAAFRGIEVFNEMLPDAASEAPPAGSSHAPLVATFDLDGA
jgi:endonuclease/exonuclease/phosphatase family metal-dependent hydrolase